MGLAIGIVVGAVAAFLLVASTRGGGRAASNTAGWRTLAVRRGGSFVLDRKSPSLEVVEGGTRIVVDTRSEREASDDVFGAAAQFTRARADFELPVGPVFVVTPRGDEPLCELPGPAAITISLGVDPAFDRRFVVDTTTAEATRACWTVRAMRLARAEIRESRLMSDGVTLTIDTPGLVTDAVVLERLILLAAELAGADLFGLGALRALPGAADREGGAPGIEMAAPAAVVFAPIVAGDRCVTEARLPVARSGVAFRAVISASGELTGDVPKGALPAAAFRVLARTGAGRLDVQTDSVCFTWRQVETDPARLMAAANLLASFTCAAETGVYR